MPIEFPCLQCNTLLRVPDAAAGKHAKCAKCGAIMLTPAESQPLRDATDAPGSPASPTTPSRSTSPPNPREPSEGQRPLGEPFSSATSSASNEIENPTPDSAQSNPPASPFDSGESSGSQTTGSQTPTAQNDPFRLLRPQGEAETKPAGNPFGGKPDNPYQAPNANPFSDVSPAGRRYEGRAAQEIVRAKLLPVGIAVFLIGLLSLMFHGLAIIGSLDEINQGPLNDEEVMGLVMVFLWTVWSIVLIVSGVAMMRKKSLVLCWIGTVASLLPCTCCLMFSMPVGIWAAVILSDPLVANEIRNASEPF